MRQSEDQVFVVVLKRMTSGAVTNYDISYFETRVVNSEEVPNDAIHLIWSKEETSNFNAVKLSQIPTDAVLSIAKDSVKAMGISENANIFKIVKVFETSETQGLFYELKLKTIAKDMIK